MIKKYKTTRIVRNIKAIQLKENNIMDVVAFLDCVHFHAIIDESNNISRIFFDIDDSEQEEWVELMIGFGDYVVNIDGKFELYSEKDFKQLFEEEK